MDFEIACANHKNNRENYKGFYVQDLPTSENKTFGFYYSSNGTYDAIFDLDSSFGVQSEPEVREPMVRLLAPSKSLYQNLENGRKLG